MLQEVYYDDWSLSLMIYESMELTWSMAGAIHNSMAAAAAQQAIINCLDDAHAEIDRAVSICLKESKPVYISVSCNLAGTVHPSFTRSTIPYAITRQYVNEYKVPYTSKSSSLTHQY
jgi:TPP-dependent 2-oxoacid decarboxylase